MDPRILSAHLQQTAQGSKGEIYIIIREAEHFERLRFPYKGKKSKKSFPYKGNI